MTLHRDKYDHTYFEKGIENGISLYENYRWIPKVSLPLANFIKKTYKNQVILDYGCAKGFLVHALRLLNVNAYGYDISEYALKNCKREIKEYLFNNKENLPNIDVIVAKDVFEHFDYELIDDELNWMNTICKKMFVIVPLGEDNKYRIPEYGFDKTHIIKENEDWWIEKFRKSKFTIDSFYYRIENIKKNWYEHNEFGNAFFFLEKN